MKDTLLEICELQKSYSYRLTPQMRRRGSLIRTELVSEIRAARDRLSKALGRFGDDFFVEGSDGITNKTELAWVRFCSKRMSPRPTTGFYVVLHFSLDGSAVNIAVGCSSSKFVNGYNKTLPPKDIDLRCEWARKIVREFYSSSHEFTDSNAFGATKRLPISFERACALVKKNKYLRN